MSLQNLSIKQKLTLMAMLTSTVAMVLSTASFFIYDLASFRDAMSQDLTTQAKIIAYNSAAAMAFKDESAATETLSALKAKRDVLAAILYSPDGKRFAIYLRDGTLPSSLPAGPEEPGHRFDGTYLKVFGNVILNGERVGTLFLQSDMSQWDARLRQYAGILTIIVFVTGLFAWLISSKLQLWISRPILHLEDTMRIVSSDKNYGVRAIKSYSDEIGRLIDGFNTMLSEIQHRDSALQQANIELQNRTGELEEEVVQRQEAQEELLRAKKAAEDANRAKSLFLANMSHELRTPLNAILGYSEMLEEETRESGRVEYAHDLQKIQGAGKHLLSLINDVLDLSKIEAGRMGLNLESFDVSRMIKEIVTTLEPSVAKNANKLGVRLSDNLGVMRGDATKVRQILYNLLSNACKFTDHGSILVEAERSTAEGQDWIRFRVSDTGIGITAEQKRNLFQEFTQADISISRKYGGTGLGLAISQRFVEMMKGHIGFESEPGRGSVFTVHLPAQIATEAPDASPRDALVGPSAARSEGKSDTDKILVIDDDPAVRDLMSRYLTKLDFQVVVAADGEEGLRLARQVHPLVITLDVIMPGMNGWLVLHELKADSALADIPVIMVTVVDNEVMGLDLGAANYLVKPIVRDRLVPLLERYRQVQPAASAQSTEPATASTSDGQGSRSKTGIAKPKRS